MNFELAREKMVDCQIRPNNVTRHEILAAMLSVPREEFVGDEMRELAYLDRDIEIQNTGGKARYMMAATPLSKLIQLADPQSENVALVVGSGNGYSCALLSMLVMSVVALEEDNTLAEQSGERLSSLGYDNVVVLSGALNEGWEREAPYDIILVEGSVEEISERLLDQLAEDGRLVAVVGQGNAAQATLFHKTDGLVGKREVFNCSIPKLPGFERIEGFSF
ncbi:MAG: protein-L-isoaspartate O-methyltransferase [Pseudomonadota bacterium]